MSNVTPKDRSRTASDARRGRAGAPLPDGGHAPEETRVPAAPPAVVRSSKSLRVGLAYNLKRIVAKSAGDDDSHAEYDSEQTIDRLAAAIASHGHEVVRLEATRDIVVALPASQVDLVFNLSEGEHGRGREAHVPALCEMWGVSFTGSDAATMATALDKNIAKHVVAGSGVLTPRALLMTGDEPGSALASLRFPLIAKPNAEGSSKGVLPRCVVDDEAGLRSIVRELHAKYRQPVLVEEFLPGREFTVAVLGRIEDGTQPEILPPMEIVFLEGSGAHPVYAFEDKLDWSRKIRYEKRAALDASLRTAIHDVVRRAWFALGCRDVARFDIRCDAFGQPFFIEANPLPGMTPGWSDLCMIAEAEGLAYDALIGRIMAPAIRRLERARGLKQETPHG
jgi:D-alanine--D-alanine ligase